MANRKKEVYKVKPLNENKKNIIAALIDEYNIETAEDIQEALKDLLGGTLKSMMEAEMDEHLGYESYERSNNPNYRNGTKTKTVRGNFGEIELAVPQDRDSTFEPKIVKKRQKDISDIDQKIISMYARGLTTRQISEQIEELYGFECSEGFISDVTDKILQDITDWQNRPLDDIYRQCQVVVEFLFDKSKVFLKLAEEDASIGAESANLNLRSTGSVKDGPRLPLKQAEVHGSLTRFLHNPFCVFAVAVLFFLGPLKIRRFDPSSILSVDPLFGQLPQPFFAPSHRVSAKSFR